MIDNSPVAKLKVFATAYGGCADKPADQGCSIRDNNGREAEGARYQIGPLSLHKTDISLALIVRVVNSHSEYLIYRILHKDQKEELRTKQRLSRIFTNQSYSRQLFLPCPKTLYARKNQRR